MNYDEEFIKFQTENMNIVNKAFNIHLKQVQNQKAIECLKEVKEAIEDNCEKGCFKNLSGEMFGKFLDCDNIMIFIDNKIKELEGE